MQCVTCSFDMCRNRHLCDLDAWQHSGLRGAHIDQYMDISEEL